MPGSVLDVHEPPLSVEVVTPIPAAPPSKMRPIWPAATIVDPFENVSGSTTVLCWPATGLLNGSVRIGVWAAAVVVEIRAVTPTRTSGRNRMRTTFRAGLEVRLAPRRSHTNQRRGTRPELARPLELQRRPSTTV